ncbi:MAG: dihydrofolate reductase family protein [Anaerolineales bacterium]
MRKIIFSMSVSVDGFIEDATGDFGWAFPDIELHQHFNDSESTIDTYLYGRRMYELMTAFWPTADQDPSQPAVVLEYARIWKSKKKYVFSRTLTEAGWGFQIIHGDIAETVGGIKAQPGMDISIGGPDLASTFLRFGLIDEIGLYIHPVIVGGGKPMFPELRDKISLKLVETRTFGSGVVLLKYVKV